MAKALAMRCGIVGMGTRSVGANPGKTSTRAHVPMEIVHRVPPAEGDFEKVPLAYATQAGYAPLDRQLYLPEDWADDAARRAKCHIPPEVQFQEKWRIALDLLKRSL